MRSSLVGAILLLACGDNPDTGDDSSTAADGSSGSTVASTTSTADSSTSAVDSSTGDACGGTDIPATRLTTTADPSPAATRQNITQWNWGRCLAADDENGLHVAWTERGSTSIEYPADLPDPIDTSSLAPGRILYRRSVDCGDSWPDETELAGSAVGTDSAGVAVAGERVFAIWRELHDDRWQVLFRGSTDRGVTWGEPVVISDNPIGVSASPPSIASSSSGMVGVVWADGRERNVGAGTATTKEVSLVVSPDGGATWNPVVAVSEPDGFSSWTPAVAMQGTTVHVAWTDERDDVGECTTDNNPCREEEYYRRSDDGGASWGPEVRLTVDAPGSERESWAPSIAVDGPNVHVAFFDRRSGAFAVFFKRSLDGGDSWEDDVLLSAAVDGMEAARPTVAARDQSVEVAWFEFADFPAHVVRRHSKDGGATWTDAVALTPDDPAIAARIPHVAITPNGDAHAVWYDTRNSDAAGARVEIYYARSVD